MRLELEPALRSDVIIFSRQVRGPFKILSKTIIFRRPKKIEKCRKNLSIVLATS